MMMGSSENYVKMGCTSKERGKKKNKKQKPEVPRDLQRPTRPPTAGGDGNDKETWRVCVCVQWHCLGHVGHYSAVWRVKRGQRT